MTERLAVLLCGHRGLPGRDGRVLIVSQLQKALSCPLPTALVLLPSYGLIKCVGGESLSYLSDEESEAQIYRQFVTEKER